MIPSEIAGVLFTTHPTSGDPSEMVITANYGLGESVVSGEADPDTIILNRTWKGEVSWKTATLGSKKIKITSGIDINGTVAEELGDEEAKRFCIKEDQALLLGEVGVELEELFGGPRDIEWAFYQDKLYLLQSRPITTLNTWSPYEIYHEFDTPIYSEDSLHTRANVGEVMPGAMSVLSMSVLEKTLEKALQLSTFQSYQPEIRRATCFFNHHAFLDAMNVSIFEAF